ncbi:MAG: hypothetical protein ACYSR9_01885 [Planctomycetota bacterium]|jgi:hypothetical protein
MKVKQVLVLIAIAFMTGCASDDKYYEQSYTDLVLSSKMAAGPFYDVSSSQPHAYFALINNASFLEITHGIFLIDGKFVLINNMNRFSTSSWRVTPGKHTIEFQIFHMYDGWQLSPATISGKMKAGQRCSLTLSGVEKYKSLEFSLNPHCGLRFSK